MQGQSEVVITDHPTTHMINKLMYILPPKLSWVRFNCGMIAVLLLPLGKVSYHLMSGETLDKQVHKKTIYIATLLYVYMQNISKPTNANCMYCIIHSTYHYIMILRDKYILILVSHVLSYHPILINPSFHGKICLL